MCSTMFSTQPLPKYYHSMCAGHRPEKVASGKGGVTGVCSNGITGVWLYTGDGDSIYISGATPHNDRQLLSGDNRYPVGIEYEELEGPDPSHLQNWSIITAVYLESTTTTRS